MTVFERFITLVFVLHFSVILSQSPHCPSSITAPNQNNPGELDVFLYNADGDLVGQSTCMRAGGSPNYNCNTILTQLRNDNPDEVVFLSFGNLNNENDLGSCVYNLNGELMPSTLLPVELILFEVGFNITKQVNDIEWSTASEVNNQRFELDYSSDGFNWENIATLAGAGNANFRNDYQFGHRDFNKNGINYYRLSQYDFDGTMEVFPIISIQNSNGKVLIATYNLMGQKVDASFSGIVIDVFEDGTKLKRMQ
jgi:hypothetical protein